ncbi:hypothetical protein R1sor_022120 [Riccia sorocarpa]|uniref:GCK domain-containing protein n=1 Tax=Riccia sorocarpa TaxID=122646 RepID=A0ABD3GN79_9MARC
MTEGSDESEGEKSISTEVEDDERTDAEEEQGNDDPTLERLEVQLEEDSDLIRSDEAAEEGGSDVLEKCNFVTGTLTACMRANRNYYGPVLEAQKSTHDNLLEQPVKFKHDNDITSENTEKQLDVQDQVAEADKEL